MLRRTECHMGAESSIFRLLGCGFTNRMSQLCRQVPMENNGPSHTRKVAKQASPSSPVLHPQSFSLANLQQVHAPQTRNKVFTFLRHTPAVEVSTSGTKPCATQLCPRLPNGSFWHDSGLRSMALKAERAKALLLRAAKHTNAMPDACRMSTEFPTPCRMHAACRAGILHMRHASRMRGHGHVHM